MGFTKAMMGFTECKAVASVFFFFAMGTQELLVEYCETK